MCGGGDKPKAQKQTRGERDQAAVAGEKWNYYVQRLAPYQQKMIDKAQMTESDYKLAGRRSLVDSEAAFSEVQAAGPGAQRGGNLGVQLAKREVGKTAVRGSNLVRSGLQTDDRHAAGVESIIAAGNGERATQQRTSSFYSGLNFNRARGQAIQDAQEWADDSRFTGQVIGTAGTMAYMGARQPPATGVNSADPAQVAHSNPKTGAFRFAL